MEELGEEDAGDGGEEEEDDDDVVEVTKDGADLTGKAEVKATSAPEVVEDDEGEDLATGEDGEED